MAINPGENSLRLEQSTDRVRQNARDEIAKALAQHEPLSPRQPGDKVTIREPSVLPDELADPICEVLAPGSRRRLLPYLQIMIINDEAKSYLLVLDGPKR